MAKLRGRITQRLAGTRGVLLSMSGYSDEALGGHRPRPAAERATARPDAPGSNALWPPVSGGPAGRDGHVGVVDLDKPPRFRSTTGFAHRTQTGTASRSCSRSTPTASTARRPQLTSASPRPSAPRTPRKTSVTRATATSSRHPEMAGQSGNPGGSGLHNRSCRPRPWPFPRPSVGWSAPVRGRFLLFTHGPSTARTPKPGAHGHIADGGGPKSRLGRRPRWSPGGDSGGASGL